MQEENERQRKKSERKNARVTNTKLGYNLFRLIKTKITVCVLKYWMQIINCGIYKSVVTVYKSSSQGLTIQNTIIKKFSHRYINNVGSVEYMYYIRMIINFQKTWTALDSLYSLHVLVDILQVGNDLDTYPQQLTRNWMTDYGVFGKTTSILLSYRFWYQTG